MPGASHSEQLAPLTAVEALTGDRLRRHVEMLAGTIGGRSAEIPASLDATLDYIESQLRSFGYSPQRQSYQGDELTFQNLEAALPGVGNLAAVVVIGAHYDTAGGLPGANDNGSGVAATLELAREFARQPQQRTIRWLFFANEEPPFFQSPLMGSYVYAARSKERKETFTR